MMKVKMKNREGEDDNKTGGVVVEFVDVDCIVTLQFLCSRWSSTSVPLGKENRGREIVGLS